MAIPVIGSSQMSIAEYLGRERESLEKHEYRDGEVFLMAGASANHSLNIMNVGGELRSMLKGKTCRVYGSDLRIRIPRTVLYAYPDISIVCGPCQIDPNDSAGETITNPRVIIEVLSPNTEAYDRGEKFYRYRQLDSLEEYVLISQQSPMVETFLRQADGSWSLRSSATLESVARVRSLDIDLSLSEIYAGVEFPSAAPAVASDDDR